jgi:hypothetical protein
LAAEQRLFYGLSGFGSEAIEVRYFVKGALYLTETADLSTARLPEIAQSRTPQLQSKTPIELASLLEGERMMELLALRPDLVRRLHGLAADGTAIDVKIFRQGRQIEALSFKQLLRRSAELRAGRDVPVVIRSTVGGLGDRGEPRQPGRFLSKVLDSCSDCTDDMPCDTECGYDPGKGGPETCGEYGAPCGGSTCACSNVNAETWTSWYYNGAHLYSPPYSECLRSSAYGWTYYQAYIEEFRRDLVRHSTICPNCPSCVGCYGQDQVIDYQLSDVGCLGDTSVGCFSGRTPWCYELCLPSSVCN